MDIKPVLVKFVQLLGHTKRHSLRKFTASVSTFKYHSGIDISYIIAAPSAQAGIVGATLAGRMQHAATFFCICDAYLPVDRVLIL